MRRAAIALLLLTPVAAAQALVTAGELPRLQRIFTSRSGSEPLACDVTPITPSLNFAFRYLAGYSFHVPQSQYQASSRGWSVLTAITPEAGAATYLVGRTLLSDATRSGMNFDIHGLYFLGEGRYSVESTIRDDRNRVCRKQWQIVVKSSHANRAVPPALPRNTVRQFSPFISPDIKIADHGPPMRLSILLNAAAFSTFRTTIRQYDRTVLLGALTALLERLPAASVRLVVFSLEQQREIFRSEHFAPSDTDKVGDAMRSMQQATVDVHVLEKPLGHVDFLAGLIDRERDAPNPADTVVFLGPTSRYGNKIPEDVLPAPASGLAGQDSARFFYVRYESLRRASGMPGSSGIYSADAGGNGGRSGTTVADETTGQNGPGQHAPPSPGTGAGMGGGGGRGGGGRGHSIDPQLASPGEGQTDIITAAVARLKGKTLTIHTPGDLAKAIRRIDKQGLRP
jgi:hypothetical protein